MNINSGGGRLNVRRFHIMVNGLAEEEVKAIKKKAIDEGKSISKLVKEFILNKLKEE